MIAKQNTPRRAETSPPSFSIVPALSAGLLALLVTTPAAAQDFALHLEPAAAIWIDTPQSDRFTPGVYVAVRPSFALGRVAALQASYAFLFTPAAEGFDEAGSAHSATVGVRLRPFVAYQAETDQLGGFWMDANVGYVRTGELDRLGFDGGLGYGFQLSPVFALGPVLRYSQIVQPDDIANTNPNDAQFLSAGINFSFGRPPRPAETVEVIRYEAAPPCEQAECVQNACPAPTICPVLAPPACADRDGDGVCDDVDRCPTQAGPAASYGCPVDPCAGVPIRVLVQFAFDSNEMPAIRTGNNQTMDPVLDAVAAAIAQDPTCRVGILGHTSSEGAASYNQTLSESRARAVQQYFVTRGIAIDRIPARGMGESCPLDPVSSLELNRRVEFYRIDEGSNPQNECLP